MSQDDIARLEGRIEKLSDAFIEQVKVLTRIEEQMKQASDLEKRIEELEKDKAKITGAWWIVGIISGVVSFLVGFLRK